MKNSLRQTMSIEVRVVIEWFEGSSGGDHSEGVVQSPTIRSEGILALLPIGLKGFRSSPIGLTRHLFNILDNRRAPIVVKSDQKRSSAP